MFLLGMWALSLLAIVSLLIYRGKTDRARVKRVNKKVNSVHIKVNELWQRIK
jgi:hypothetical protein